MNKEEARYLISRLERIKELIEDGNYHMAIAKILADLSALRGVADEQSGSNSSSQQLERI